LPQVTLRRAPPAETPAGLPSASSGHLWPSSLGLAAGVIDPNKTALVRAALGKNFLESSPQNRIIIFFKIPPKETAAASTDLLVAR